MRISNVTIARFFFRISNLLEISGGDTYRIAAYRKAGEIVIEYPDRFDQMCAAGHDLTEIPGIGQGIAASIRDLVADGTFPLWEEISNSLPESLLELLRVRGLGPSRVRTLHLEHNVSTVEDLAAMVAEGRLCQVRGFSERTEDRVRRSLGEFIQQRGRLLRVAAEVLADSLVWHCEAHPEVNRAVVVGSYRRGMETVGGLKVVVATDEPSIGPSLLQSWEHIEGSVEQADSSFRAHCDGGLPVTVLTCLPKAFGVALHQHTGRDDYLAAIMEHAGRQGVVVTSDAVIKNGDSYPVSTEVDFFAALDLPLIPPELREGGEVVSMAVAGDLPELVTPFNLRGDLHMHTTFTDGRNSVREMALAARDRGYEYIAITDHTRNTRVANGLHPHQIDKYLIEIEKVDAELDGIRVLKGLEVDILADGSMDMPDEIMARLDVVIAAIHSHFDQPVEIMTARVASALENPYVQILAHPSGRLIGQRSPLLLDFDRLFPVVREYGVMLELNANPERLDIHAENCRIARDFGIPVVISTDAHAVWQFDNLPRGVRQARRGTLRPGDVLNTLPLPQLLQRLAARRVARGL
jgi:DNA polymerase (family X)